MNIERGESIETRSDWLGPVPWPVMVEAAETARLTLEEGNGKHGLCCTFTDGWLRIEGAGDGVVHALQIAMARHGGRSVQRRAWSAEAKVGTGAVEVEGQVTTTTVAPDGNIVHHPNEPVEMSFVLEAESVPDEGLREVLGETEGAVVRLTRVLDGPLAHLHPALSWRDVRMRVPIDWTPPSGVTVQLEGEEMPELVVARLLTTLGRKLDGTAEAPDLEHWAWRAARRAGFERPPEPDSDDWAAFRVVWLEITERERARPAQAGKVAAWRFRADGEWIVPSAECALLVEAVPDGPWREAFARGAAGKGCSVVCRVARPTRTPWHLDPVALQTRGERLVVTVGQQVLVEAVRTLEGSSDRIEVLHTDGITHEVASSHLRAALQRI